MTSSSNLASTGSTVRQKERIPRIRSGVSFREWIVRGFLRDENLLFGKAQEYSIANISLQRDGKSF